MTPTKVKNITYNLRFDVRCERGFGILFTKQPLKKTPCSPMRKKMEDKASRSMELINLGIVLIALWKPETELPFTSSTPGQSPGLQSCYKRNHCTITHLSLLFAAEIALWSSLCVTRTLLWFIYTKRKRTRKRIFFFDLCCCSMLTLKWILYEPIWKRCRLCVRFRSI